MTGFVPGWTLTSTAGLLLAADVPLAVELPALGMVGLVLHFLLRRETVSHHEHARRLTRIESQLEAERDARDEQRRLKHALQNEITATRATISILLPQARRCTCGTMEPLIPILDRIAYDLKETP